MSSCLLGFVFQFLISAVISAGPYFTCETNRDVSCTGFLVGQTFKYLPPVPFLTCKKWCEERSHCNAFRWRANHTGNCDMYRSKCDTFDSNGGYFIRYCHRTDTTTTTTSTKPTTTAALSTVDNITTELPLPLETTGVTDLDIGSTTSASFSTDTSSLPDYNDFYETTVNLARTDDFSTSSVNSVEDFTTPLDTTVDPLEKLTFSFSTTAEKQDFSSGVTTSPGLSTETTSNEFLFITSTEPLVTEPTDYYRQTSLSSESETVLPSESTSSLFDIEPESTTSFLIGSGDDDDLTTSLAISSDRPSPSSLPFVEGTSAQLTLPNEIDFVQSTIETIDLQSASVDHIEATSSVPSKFTESNATIPTVYVPLYEDWPSGSSFILDNNDWIWLLLLVLIVLAVLVALLVLICVIWLRTGRTYQLKPNGIAEEPHLIPLTERFGVPSRSPFLHPAYDLNIFDNAADFEGDAGSIYSDNINVRDFEENASYVAIYSQNGV